MHTPTVPYLSTSHESRIHQTFARDSDPRQLSYGLQLDARVHLQGEATLWGHSATPGGKAERKKAATPVPKDF